MTVETATYLSQLNAALPAAGDSLGEADDHLRKIKAAQLATWPNLTATPITATSADINAVVGAGTTGAAAFNVTTQATANSSTLAASTEIVDLKITAAALAASLPNQSGNSGKFVTTDGVTAAWSSIPSFASASTFNTFYGVL